MVRTRRPRATPRQPWASLSRSMAHLGHRDALPVQVRPHLHRPIQRLRGGGAQPHPTGTSRPESRSLRHPTAPISPAPRPVKPTGARAIWVPCTKSARQIGATPNSSFSSSINRQISAVAGRAPARKNPRRLENFYGLLQLAVLPALLPDLGRFDTGHPGRLTSSTSACWIRLRSVSALIPSRPETAVIAAPLRRVVSGMLTDQPAPPWPSCSRRTCCLASCHHPSHRRRCAQNPAQFTRGAPPCFTGGREVRTVIRSWIAIPRHR